MSYQFLDASGATRYASANGAGTVGDPDVPVVGVACNELTVSASSIDSAAKTLNGILFTNLRALKLGSTDGVNYTNFNDARILIPVGAAGYRNVEVVFYASNATYHNKDITLTMFPSTLHDIALPVSGGKALSITIPQSSWVYFSLSSAGAGGIGSTVGAATAAGGAYYSVPALAGAAYVTMLLSSATIPTSGAFPYIKISRTS